MRTDGEMVFNRENPVVISSGGFYFEKNNLDINMFCKYVSAFENIRFAPKTAGPQPLGDFFTIDLNGGYSFRWIRFYLRARNLTDSKYSTVVGYPDFGRMLYIGVNLRFTKILRN